jgi:hypothetical protein
LRTGGGGGAEAERWVAAELANRRRLWGRGDRQVVVRWGGVWRWPEAMTVRHMVVTLVRTLVIKVIKIRKHW